MKKPKKEAVATAARPIKITDTLQVGSLNFTLHRQHGDVMIHTGQQQCYLAPEEAVMLLNWLARHCDTLYDAAYYPLEREGARQRAKHMTQAQYVKWRGRMSPMAAEEEWRVFQEQGEEHHQ